MKLSLRFPAELPQPVRDELESLMTQIRAAFDTLAYGRWVLRTAITPPALTASQNDYEPSGLATAQWIRISSTTAVNLTGLKAGSVGDVILLTNIGSNTITLVHASASSAEANRFRCPGAGDFALATQESVWVIGDRFYDGSAMVWRLIGH